jgi:hypothetical protein
VRAHREEGIGALFREHWRSVQFWRWWWRTSVASELKWLLAAVLIPALLVGGYFASGSLGGASASDAADSGSYVLQTTVRKVVTVREHGKTVVKRVPVVVRKSVVKVRSRTETQIQTSVQTVENTRVLTTAGKVRTIERKVTKYVPVTTKVQLVNGRTTTITQTVTNESTVVQTVTQPAPPPQTVIQTQTVVQTVTQPGQTVTVTVTAPSS